jgi:hypothetical protein
VCVRVLCRPRVVRSTSTSTSACWCRQQRSMLLSLPTLPPPPPPLANTPTCCTPTRTACCVRCAAFAVPSTWATPSPTSSEGTWRRP